MGVNRFEDLRVWQLAKTLSDEIGAVIRTSEFSRDRALSGQLNAAVLSTIANIAEGFVRAGGKEFNQYVRIAAASNAEARALLHAAYGRHYLSTLEYQRLTAMTESIGRMLRVLSARLQERSSGTKHQARPKN